MWTVRVAIIGIMAWVVVAYWGAIAEAQACRWCDSVGSLFGAMVGWLMGLAFLLLMAEAWHRRPR